ncbi:MAG: MATE family efflux transporter [Lachnospiraceae bacterium]|nr:MATE family efflux transporter [Lachnospiraceae bacterium]
MTHDMTKGRLLPILIRFTIPLILGNLLQLTYNAVDSIIVGRFVGSGALAAVGTGNPLITLFMLFEQGICLGAGVLIGTMYGAKDYDRLKRQISTGLIAGMVFSAVVSLLVILAAPQLLTLLRIHPSILGEAVAYLRLIALGMIFNFLYNYFAATLRALGDSRSALYFLSVSAALNIAGDLFFVVVLRMGVHGAALSTVISEALAGLLCWLYVQKKIPLLQLGREWLNFDAGLLKLTLSYGFVTAMQQSAVQLGKVGVQGLVNTLGVASAAAYSAGIRADDYAMIVEQNIAHAMTSVMAQNRGAGLQDRVRKSFQYGMMLEAGYGILSGIVFYAAARPLIGLFSTDPEVIQIGTQYIRMMAFMYILPAATNGIQGYFRGMGDLKITLVSSIINMGVRVAAAAPMILYFHMGLEAIPWACLLGWVGMMVYEIPFLIRRKLVQK